MKLYRDQPLYSLIQKKVKMLLSEIETLKEDRILNIGLEQLIEQYKETYYLPPPYFLEDKVYAEDFEGKFNPSEYPKILKGNTPVLLTYFIYHLPFDGDLHLLKYTPSQYKERKAYDVIFDDLFNTIQIKIIDFYERAESVERAYEYGKQCVLSCHKELIKEIENYNNALDKIIRDALEKRKSKVLRRKKLINSLSIPIKKRHDVAKTFAVPKPKLRKKITISPKVKKSNFQAEPALDFDTYYEILKIINDVGKNFERLPSVYANKKEEDLRDHFLLILDPNFEYGNASGETFNKKGKTDIQLRYDSSVLFISECKFWAGKESLRKTINQLLSYLTWRDSKTSIIFFVKNKSITSVLNTVLEEVPKHTNFIKENPKTDSSWFNYIFNLPIDPNKEIFVSIQLFHIP